MTCTELDVHKLLGPSLSEQNSDSNAPCISLSTEHGAQSSEERAHEISSRSEPEIRARDQQLEISSRSELEISSSSS